MLKRKLCFGMSWFECILACILLFIAFSILSLMGYFAFYKRVPVAFNSITVLESSVEAGGYLTVEVDLCKFTDAPYIKYRSWRDGLIFSEPPVSAGGSSMDRGCVSIQKRVLVPKLPSGEYHISYKFVYHVGPLLDRIVTYDTNRFIVVNKL